MKIEAQVELSHMRSYVGLYCKSNPDGIESCLREAKQDQSVPADLNTADTARFIFHAFEGAIMHMKVEKSIEPYRAFRRYLSGYLKK